MGTEMLAATTSSGQLLRQRLRSTDARKNRYVALEIIFLFMPLRLLLLLNFAAAAYLTGLIWTVQVVHYPSFGKVPKEAWAAFHAAHTRRMGYVVLAPMVLEIGLAGWLAGLGRPRGVARRCGLVGPSFGCADLGGYVLHCRTIS